MGENIVLFGASNLGRLALDQLKKSHSISYFCDNDNSKWGQKFEGIEIIPPDSLKRVENLKLYITTMYFEQVEKQLGSMGINNYEIYKCSDTMKPLSLWDSDGEFGAYFSEILGKSLVDKTRCYILYQFAKHVRSLDGDICEVGVYKGGTARLLSRVSQESEKTIHLFDTFSGMPETDSEKDIHTKGDFGDTSIDAVREFLSDCHNVSFYQGLFPETAKPVEDSKFCLVHIDVDIYKSVLDCCSFFYSRLSAGGAMIFDDFGFSSCPGARLAVEEFFMDKLEQPVYLPTGQALIVKL